MYKLIMQNIQGVEIWPLIALVIFFTVFTVMIIWVFRVDKRQLDRWSEIPLQNDDESLFERKSQNER